MSLAHHFLLALGFLHEQMARRGFATDNLELSLAAGHFESFFGATVGFELHGGKLVDDYLSGDKIMNRLNPCFFGA